MQYIFLSTGIPWLIVYIYDTFSRRFIQKKLRKRLHIIFGLTAGFLLLVDLIEHMGGLTSDDFLFLISFFCIWVIVVSVFVLFIVKLALKHLAPESNAGWRIIFAMTGGSYLFNFSLPFTIDGRIDMFAGVIFMMLLPFTAFCAIFFDILGAICVKWFQTRKAGQSNS
jgi:hypothetical protein